MRSWCPEGHPFRGKPEFGTEAQRAADPPEFRTHDETGEQGHKSEVYTGPENAHPRKSTGVNGTCALVFLFLFNLIWDVCPDMMHIIKNFFEKLTFKVFRGSRIPTWSAKTFGLNAPPQPKKKVGGQTVKKKEYAEQMKVWRVKKTEYETRRAEWATACNQHQKVVFTAEDQGIVDRRLKQLVGPSKWIKATMVQDYVIIYYVIC
jgi:hypothetical protein